jgi:hypothetical protein
VTRLLHIIAAAVAVGTFGCAVSPLQNNCCALPGDGRYCLRSTAPMEPFDAVQSVTIEAQGRQTTLIATLEVDKSGIRMAGLTPLGQKLVTVEYDNESVRAEHHIEAARPLDPALLLALLQLALWPESEVAAGLVSPLRLASAGNSREIVAGDRVVLTIERDGNVPPYRELRIKSSSFGFALMIRTVSSAATAKDEP